MLGFPKHDRVFPWALPSLSGLWHCQECSMVLRRVSEQPRTHCSCDPMFHPNLRRPPSLLRLCSSPVPALEHGLSEEPCYQ